MRTRPDGVTSATDDERSDAELLAAVRGGDQAAYGVLWVRHEAAARSLAKQVARPADVDELVSESFYRVLRAIAGGGGPDGAFRPYLLSALRRVNIDTGRTYYQRVHLTDDDAGLDIVPSAAAHDVAMERHEHSAAWRAWASLPESTRTLLWHLVVEEDTPAKLAPLLGTTPNGVSSRAKRARERLRQAFLQQHVLEADNEACRWVRSRLGQYERDALSRTEQSVVEEHLRDCAGCTAAASEVQDVNKTMRAMIAPVVLGSPEAAKHYLRSAHWTEHGTVSPLKTMAKAATSGKVAACVAMAVVAGVVLPLMVFDNDDARVSLPAPSVRATAPIASDTPVSTQATRPSPTTPPPSKTPTSKPSTSSATPSASPTASPTRWSHSTSVPQPRASAPEPPRLTRTPASAGAPTTGTTVTRQVTATLTELDRSDATVVITVSQDWAITSISGPSDSDCHVHPDGTAVCAITSPEPSDHTYGVSVTGPDGATGEMCVSYRSVDGAADEQFYTF